MPNFAVVFNNEIVNVINASYSFVEQMGNPDNLIEVNENFRHGTGDYFDGEKWVTKVNPQYVEV